MELWLKGLVLKMWLGLRLRLPRLRLDVPEEIVGRERLAPRGHARVKCKQLLLLLLLLLLKTENRCRGPGGRRQGSSGGGSSCR